MPRCMTLAGITPPATLSVVSGFNNETEPLSLASLDWDSSAFFDGVDLLYSPSSDVLQIATLAAQSMAIIPPTPPAANSSFHLHFYGPTLQCDTANSTQQSNFDYYAKALANSSFMIATKDLYESGRLRWGSGGPPGGFAPIMNVYSAFSPYAQPGINPSNKSSIDFSIDEFNNWAAEIPPKATPETALPGWGTFEWWVTQQLWIQTSDKGLVCIMGNASFDVDFEFVDSSMTAAIYSVSTFEPFWMPIYGVDLWEVIPTNRTIATLPSDFWNPTESYMAVYLAF